MSASVNVVQFPHPGAEHRPGRTDAMPWNSGAHRRKFLRSPGSWVDGCGAVNRGDMTFWGEWEAPSRIARRWPADGHLPRFLHQPVLSDPPVGRYVQNTDPLVFGHRFRYSNCKQFDTTHGRPSGLQDLARGSIILFGSRLGGEFFVLDTVFVVADGRPFSLGDPDCLADEPFVQRVVVEPLRSGAGGQQRKYTLFDGAMYDEPVEGMYSFVPGLPVDGEPQRFARPVIELPGFINPLSHQSPRSYTARDSVALDAARNAWRAVTDRVLAAGCVLGFDLEEPRWTSAVPPGRVGGEPASAPSPCGAGPAARAHC
ncbi:hypothetical protein ACL02U_14605 [Streptomyces sp. MS06]|uniref:hypothetical protein n=1 Tax=Streptomyces sp. MS06 TaxID=3385974 RepID=UPI0039A3D8D0